MATHSLKHCWLFFLVPVLMFGSSGCRVAFPHSFVLPPGNVERSHAEPPGAGYYQNWDPYAESIKVSPEIDLNPVRTQHVLIASVKDANGKNLCNRRVEWIISEGSVGDFVEVDESGFLSTRGHKVTNKYAITHTNCNPHVLTRGTDDPSDDIHLKSGETWAVLTSPVEGTSHVVAYAPGIYDWNKHKAFVTKHWRDVEWVWPADATNPVDTPHVFTTEVRKHSDGTPLEGYIVSYSLISGPDGSFEESGDETATVMTDAGGFATVTLLQAAPREGTNEIQIEIVRPKDECCEPEAWIAKGVVTKTWAAAKINITKDAPDNATVDEVFAYDLVVSNPSDVAAEDVIVEDVLPDGIEYVSSSPNAQAQGQNLAWSLGTIRGRESKSISITVKGTKTGRFTNCANVQAAMGLRGEACDDTVITAPALSLEKECPAEVILCETIPYKVIVRNTGDGPAHNVTIRDELPDGLRTEDGKKVVVFDAGTLAPGEAKQATFNVRAERPGTYENVASTSADGGLSADASCTTTVNQPQLAVSKSGPDLRFINRPAKYKIVVTNPGDAPARETMLVDNIPAGTEVRDVSDGGQVDQGKITWNLGTLNPGDSREVALTLVAREAGVIRNSATATAYCAEASDVAETRIEGIAAILLEVIDVEDPIEVGGNVTYEITVTNQGSAVGTNIAIQSTLPQELEFVRTEGPTNGVLQGNVVTFAPLPSLAPRQKATYRVIAKGVAVGDIRFMVTMTSDQMNPPPVQETESTTIY